MSSVLESVLVIVAMTTVIAVAALLVISFCRHHPARRHTVGLLGLGLILSTPLLATALPRTTWWQSWGQAALNSFHRSQDVATSNSVPPRAFDRIDATIEIEDTDHAVNMTAKTSKDASTEDSDTIIATTSATPARKISSMPTNSIPPQKSSLIDTIAKLLALVWVLGSAISLLQWWSQIQKLQRLIPSLAMVDQLSSRDRTTINQILQQIFGPQASTRVAVSELTPMPMVIGFWKPTIVIPQELLNPDSLTKLREVLIHEYAHLVRYDIWISVTQRLASLVWWWHPGVIGLNRQISQSREEVCDNFVLHHSDAVSYAQTLLELTERCSRLAQVSPSLGLWGTHWTLEERITGLLTPERNLRTRSTRRATCGLAILFGALCLLVGGVRAVEPQKSAPNVAVTDNAAEPQPAVVKPAENHVERTMTIRGVCVDEQSKPMGQVQVLVFRQADYFTPPLKITETTTDDEGKFELTNLIANSSRARPQQLDLFLTLTAKGHVTQFLWINADDPETLEKQFELSSAEGVLSGIVTDLDGHPIPGATVFRPVFGQHPIPGVLSAVTDAKGRFAINGLQQWTPESTQQFDAKTNTGYMTTEMRFAVTHPDYPLTLASCTAIPQYVKVSLSPPAIVEGIVIDAVTKRPLADIPVTAQGIAEHGGGQTRTDAQGAYRLTLTSDHYNIWAESDNRIAVAVKALNAESGKTVTNANIQMVRGGFIVGEVLDAKGKPIRPTANHGNFVAHYGPARPRTGAAVGVAKITDNGNFRLHVAPGRNYVYLMNGDYFAYVNVKDGEEVRFNLQQGVTPPKSGAKQEPDPDEELARKIRFDNQQAKQRAIRAKGNGSPAKQPQRRVRGGASGPLLDQLEIRDVGSDFWLRTMKQLADLGPDAVPDLIAELDDTEDRRMLQCLGFILRAIGDRRAVPALIRAIPKTLQRGMFSDSGLNTNDREVLAFAQKHQWIIRFKGKPGIPDTEFQKGNEYHLGRPISEIFSTLYQLTGQELGEDEINSVRDTGTPTQRAIKRAQFLQTAKKWSDWWEKHWDEFVQDKSYSRVNLVVKPEAESDWILQPEMRFRIQISSGLFLDSIQNPTAKFVLFDLDTGRQGHLPEKWRGANLETKLDEILAWATQEGFDMLGMESESSKSGERIHTLRPIDLELWQLGRDRWKPEEEGLGLKFTVEEVQAKGTKTEELEFYDLNSNSFDPMSTASFLCITREGTPCLLHVGLEETVRGQGRKFTFQELEQVQP
ncbi:M56 family metallopeptidase [Schlesneria paludicola]|uniref:M56 family metallopeptidase n=1 Tax=Schlesneria paludicola TaxID=360056 RepID=UPI000299FF73|nr:M56 family metallopeptidase [Schlesneria paludicola]